MSKAFSSRFFRPTTPHSNIRTPSLASAFLLVLVSFHGGDVYHCKHGKALAPTFLSYLRVARRSHFVRGLDETPLKRELSSKFKAASNFKQGLGPGAEGNTLRGGNVRAAVQFKGIEAGSGEERKHGQRVAESSSPLSTMSGLLDLEKQFSFYGAYHSNRVNIFIHILFVWPIFYTSLILWAYTPALAPLPLPGGTFPFQQYMILNCSFIQTAVYALYYVALDKKAGSLGAAMCLGGWVAANAIAQALPWSLSWKIVLASQITCWIGQIYGHQKFEGRAPALLDNLTQAFLMAPFFVLLECLQWVGYEPYPGFHRRVQKNVDEAIREFRTSKGKKAA